MILVAHNLVPTHRHHSHTHSKKTKTLFLDLKKNTFLNCKFDDEKVTSNSHRPLNPNKKLIFFALNKE